MPFPRITYTFPKGMTAISDTDLLEIIASLAYTSDLARLQGMRAWAVHVLPADTAIKANRRGFDADVNNTLHYSYNISETVTRSSAFGFSSYEALVNVKRLEDSGNRVFLLGERDRARGA
ncbi:hypothetical protein PG993_003625 [Apiospora rasikravindrae]|uniref:Uncharacterized protein n=1 Tax=Apiospora rasikravindrae TaxID=990691 RepID=A0ABR1U028_9PEZI